MTIKERKKKIEEQIKQRQEEINNLVEEYNRLQELEFEESEEYIKIVCLGCSGRGYIKDNKELRSCQYCKGKGYLWAKKWSGQNGIN